jgi:hypothetical protein
MEKDEIYLQDTEEPSETDSEDLRKNANKTFNDNGSGYVTKATRLVQKALFNSFRYSPLYMCYDALSIGALVKDLEHSMGKKFVSHYFKQESQYIQLADSNGKSVNYNDVNKTVTLFNKSNKEVTLPIANLTNGNLFDIAKLAVLEDDVFNFYTIAEIQADPEKVKRLKNEHKDMYIMAVLGNFPQLRDQVAGLALGGVNIQELNKSEKHAKKNIKKDVDNGRSDSKTSITERFGKIPRLFIGTIKNPLTGRNISSVSVEKVLTRVANNLAPTAENGNRAIDEAINTLSKYYDLFFYNESKGMPELPHRSNKLERRLIIDALFGFDIISKETAKKNLEDEEIMAAMKEFEGDADWANFKPFFDTMLNVNGFTHKGVSKYLIPLFSDLETAAVNGTVEEVTAIKEKIIAKANELAAVTIATAEILNQKADIQKRIDAITAKIKNIGFKFQADKSLVYDKNKAFQDVIPFKEALVNQQNMIGAILSMTQSAIVTSMVNTNKNRDSTSIKTIRESSVGHLHDVIKNILADRFSDSSMSDLPNNVNDIKEMLEGKHDSKYKVQIDLIANSKKVGSITVLYRKKGTGKFDTREILLTISVDKNGRLDIDERESNTPQGVNRNIALSSLASKLFPGLKFYGAVKSGNGTIDFLARVVLQHTMAFDMNTMSDQDPTRWDSFIDAGSENKKVFEIKERTTTPFKGEPITVRYPVGLKGLIIGNAAKILKKTNSSKTLATKVRTAGGVVSQNRVRLNNSIFVDIAKTISGRIDKAAKKWNELSLFYPKWGAESAAFELQATHINGGININRPQEVRKMSSSDMDMHNFFLFVHNLFKYNTLLIPEPPQSLRSTNYLLEIEDGRNSFSPRYRNNGIAAGLVTNYKAILQNLADTFGMYQGIAYTSMNSILLALSRNGVGFGDLMNQKENLSFEQYQASVQEALDKTVAVFEEKGLILTTDLLQLHGMEPLDIEITKDGRMVLGSQANFKFIKNDKVMTLANFKRIRALNMKIMTEEEAAKFVDTIFDDHYKLLKNSLDIKTKEQKEAYKETMKDIAKVELDNYYGKHFDEYMKAYAISYYLTNINYVPIVMGETIGFVSPSGLSKRGMALSQPYTAFSYDGVSVPKYFQDRNSNNLAAAGATTTISERFRTHGANLLVVEDTTSEGFSLSMSGSHSIFNIDDLDGAINCSPFFSGYVHNSSGGSYGQSTLYTPLKIAAAQAGMPMKGLIVPIHPELFEIEGPESSMLKELRLMLEPHGKGIVKRRVENGNIMFVTVKGIETPYAMLMRLYYSNKANNIEQMKAWGMAVEATEKHILMYDIDTIDLMPTHNSVKRKVRTIKRGMYEQALEGTQGTEQFPYQFNMNETGINTNFSATVEETTPDVTSFQQIIEIQIGTHADRAAARKFFTNRAQSVASEREDLTNKIIPDKTLKQLIKDKTAATLNTIIDGLNKLASTSQQGDYMANPYLSTATAEKGTKIFQYVNKKLQKVIKPKLAGLRTADRGRSKSSVVELSWIVGENTVTEVFPSQYRANLFLDTLPQSIKDTVIQSRLAPRKLNHSIPMANQVGKEAIIDAFNTFNSTAGDIAKAQSFQNLFAMYRQEKDADGNDVNVGTIEDFINAPDDLFLLVNSKDKATKTVLDSLFKWYGNQLVANKSNMTYRIGENIGASVMANKYHCPKGATMAELFYAFDEENIIDLRTLSAENIDQFIPNKWYENYLSNEGKKDTEESQKEFLKAVAIVQSSRKSLSVRTPSTNAHSGLMTENIYFLQDSGMLTYYNPLDMFARGSDQDGDQSSHYHLLPEGETSVQGIEVAKNNLYLNFAFDYYTNPEHFANIFKPINVDTLVKAIEKRVPDDHFLAGAATTGSELIESAVDGEGIRLYAVYQKAYSFMLQYFDGTISDVIVDKNSLFPTAEDSLAFFDDTVEKIAMVMGYMGDTGNVLVDNGKYAVAGIANMVYEFIPLIMYSFNDSTFIEKVEYAGLYESDPDLNEYQNRMNGLVAFLMSPQMTEIGNSKESYFKNGRYDSLNPLKVALDKAERNTKKREASANYTLSVFKGISLFEKGKTFEDNPLYPYVTKIFNNINITANERQVAFEIEIEGLKGEAKVAVESYIESMKEALGLVKEDKEVKRNFFNQKEIDEESDAKRVQKAIRYEARNQQQYLIAKFLTDKYNNSTEQSQLSKYQKSLFTMKEQLMKHLDVMLYYGVNESDASDLRTEIDIAITEAIKKGERIDDIIEMLSIKKMMRYKTGSLISQMYKAVCAGKKTTEQIAKEEGLTNPQKIELDYILNAYKIKAISDEAAESTEEETALSVNKISLEELQDRFGISDDAVGKMFAVQKAGTDSKEAWKDYTNNRYGYERVMERMASLMNRASGNYNFVYDMIIDYAISGQSIMNFASFANLNQFSFNSDYAIWRFENNIEENFGVTIDEFKEIFSGTKEEAVARLYASGDMNFETRVQNTAKYNVDKNPKNILNRPSNYSFTNEKREDKIATRNPITDIASKADWLMHIATHDMLFEMAKTYLVLNELGRAKMHMTPAAQEATKFVRNIQKNGGKKYLTEAETVTITKAIQDYYYSKYLQEYYEKNKEKLFDNIFNKGLVVGDEGITINTAASTPLIPGIKIDLSTPEGIYFLSERGPDFIYKIIQQYKAAGTPDQQDAVANNMFINDLKLDTESRNVSLVVNDVQDGTEESDAYKLGVETLPLLLKELVSLYMLATGGLGYSKGISQFMPLSMKEDADAYIRGIMTQENYAKTAAEMRDYLEDRIAGTPEDFLYTASLKDDEKTSVAANVRITSSENAEKGSNEYDVVYRDEKMQTWKLPFGKKAMTVIAGKMNKVKVQLNQQADQVKGSIEHSLLRVDAVRNFTYNKTKYASIAAAYIALMDKDLSGNDNRRILVDIAEAAFKGNKAALEELATNDYFVSNQTEDGEQIDSKDISRIKFDYGLALNGLVHSDFLEKNGIKKDKKPNTRVLIFPTLTIDIARGNIIEEARVTVNNISEMQAKIYTPGTKLLFPDGAEGTVKTTGNGKLVYEVTKPNKIETMPVRSR